jgi:hypothetical protein
MEHPSMRHRITRARWAESNLFILTIILERAGNVNEKACPLRFSFDLSCLSGDASTTYISLVFSYGYVITLFP